MDFNEVRQRVFEKTPVFKRVVETYGPLPLEAYFSRLISAPCLVRPERQEELLSIVEERLRPLIGSADAIEIRRELGERYAVSTADHHGPLAHPFFFSCHLAQAAALRRGTHRTLFVFSCGGISLNNSSFPRGLLAHDARLELVRFPLFSLKHRHESVYGMPGYAEEEVRSIADEVSSSPRFSTIARSRLAETVRSVYADPAVVARPYYADQITMTNYALFSRLPGQEDMRFVMLQQEDVVADALVRYHFGRGTLLENIFTDPATLAAFEVCFDGVTGAFSTDRRQGTVLVWALRRGERIALSHVGHELVSDDGSYRITLDSESLRDGFVQKELVPSMALSFVVLSFYYGLTCAGGFSQVNYLTAMKRAYLRFLEHVGASSEEGLAAAEIETERLTADTAFAFIGNEKRRTPATALDFVAYNNGSDTAFNVRELAQFCTLGDALDQLMPELYRILYRETSPAPSPNFSYLNALYAP